ncbi:MAG: hypothetical protein JW787_02170 [Sedimentisphaerales bacterium]|nr:hypothetical protein [Sedimentisphaerales bacterium]
MNEFIEKNRKLLEFYRFVAKIIGWILIGLTPFLIYRSYYLLTTYPQEKDSTYLFLLNIRNFIVYYFCLGFILLGIAHFIKYIYSKESKVGWLLKHLNQFLYIYAFLMAIGNFIELKFPIIHKLGFLIQDSTTYLLTQIILTLTYILIIIGLGHIMSRILPVIEESKTLV